ncbi:flagellar motor switch protein FliG [Methylophilus sp. VKM B-3414]|jgi:flagellar motor switch protein FliG|uniref:flagellar motor switch protein FliG n=1 Tax=unclassified Methylophilus TaxID=2630143 RepID=UPI00188EFB62|nr:MULTISPECIES: flagellar motor switch protein FliG [unclassified Methylophilus]MBF5038154.1 flagellar motor switch protein FliG [Methylophilus sp. 13]MDT7850554.1 flagellar motor switch protein FliG [Methylophilus sp. VKM B-3414]BEV07879.1 flagellar motor switch protein FliG [Methylophilus sp. DW102]
MTEGLTKSAILMLALGEDEAAEVMKYLSPKEVQRLGIVMASMKPVPREEVTAVLESFMVDFAGSSDFGLDSDAYIRSVLIKAFGDDKASNLLSRIPQSQDAAGIESLKWMDAFSVSEFIKNEHPQIIATILSHLEADQAAEILGHFTDRLRQDVILRIATLDSIKPAALKELNEGMMKMLSGNENLKRQPIGGVKTAAEIMNYLSGDNEAKLMEGLKSYDDNMAQEIMDQMFVFDNILEIDDKGIQTLLREVQSDMLIVALKGTSDEMKEKFLRNMSSRAADMMREDMESRGPVKLSEVEAQQKQILQIVRRLADEGQIMLAAKGDGEQYV